MGIRCLHRGEISIYVVVCAKRMQSSEGVEYLSQAERETAAMESIGGKRPDDTQESIVYASYSGVTPW